MHAQLNRNRKRLTRSEIQIRGSALIWLLIIICLGGVLAAIALPGLFYRRPPNFPNNIAKTYIGMINNGQRGLWLERRSFTDSIDTLKIGIENTAIPEASKNYQFSIRKSAQAAFSYAKPLHDYAVMISEFGLFRWDSMLDRKLNSYVGAVFLVPLNANNAGADKDELTTVAILCEATATGKAMRLVDPFLKNNIPNCPPGMIKLGS